MLKLFYLHSKLFVFLGLVTVISGTIMYFGVKSYIQDRQLRDVKSAQVEEALHRKDLEIEQITKDLEDIQRINKKLTEEVEWARFQVSRREKEMADLKAASSVEVQKCLELPINSAFLP